jgi:hypothetical protein
VFAAAFLVGRRFDLAVATPWAPVVRAIDLPGGL